MQPFERPGNPTYSRIKSKSQRRRFKIIVNCLGNTDDSVSVAASPNSSLPAPFGHQDSGVGPFLEALFQG
jgi:hypothetical protein